MTEKFFDPLVAGSIPVYLGAPNVERFAPGDHCFIDVKDFRSPAELASYLRHRASAEDERLADTVLARSTNRHRFGPT